MQFVKNRDSILSRHQLIERHSTALSALLVLLLLVSPAFGQSGVAIQNGTPVDAKTQAEIIDSVAYALNEVYVFPEVAKQMEKHIRKQYKDKAYKEITTLEDFIGKLTEDLRSISHDRHLAVRLAPESATTSTHSDTLTDAEREQIIKRSAYNNFAFKKIEILPGNVGYIKIDGFNEATWAGATAIAAMNFLANCDAIIFDLRENGGGQPSLIQLITSYFFNEPQHLNSFYIRKEDTTQQFWTQAYVQGPRMADVEIYILTSSYTFSGAEEFTYNLKNMKRATIVGETTGGGAHPSERRIFPNLKVGMSLPYGRAINPITGTNWEGTGIEPHIKTSKAEALNVAYLEALKKLKDKYDDEEIKRTLAWKIETLESKYNPYSLDESALKEYVGTYGPRKITLKDGALHYQREEGPVFKLVPMAKDKFRIDELDYFRPFFERDEGGRVVKFVGLYDNGYTDSHLKNK
ncbi:MAG: S41 family peptidase [candidate division Zixibacteria bacterium]|nr:S41 family peptidase [candidate division Zixibacteria bacterium]